MIISGFNDKHMAIRCSTPYQKWLLMQDCEREGIKYNYHYFTGDNISIYRVLNNIIICGTPSYFAVSLSHFTIIDYELPKDDIRNIKDGVIFRHRGRRTVAKRVVNGRSVHSRSSYCHKDDDLSVPVGERIAISRLFDLTY